MLTLWLVVAGVYGLFIGSFLNVVIWRLPRGGSVATPTWSYCPNCKHQLTALDLFPMLSFLALGAKCRYCRTPISWRYPGVETLTGALFLLVTFFAYQRGGLWYDAVFECLFAALLVCVFFIDLEHFIIPDGLCVLGCLLGLAHGLVAGRFLDSLYGMLGYAAVLVLIGLVSYVVLVSLMDKRVPAGRATGEYLRDTVSDTVYVWTYSLGAALPPLRRWAVVRWGEPAPVETYTADDIQDDEDAGGMGMGDGKLAAAIGANLGLSLALGSLGFAIFVGAVAGVIVIIRQRRRLGERTAIPFGPAMAVGALLALFYGHPLASWYVQTLLPPAAGNGGVAASQSPPRPNSGEPELGTR